MPTATAVNWNIINWIFQCKYQFECLSSLETIYVIFILWCTIFHFLLFLDSLCLCLCLLFSHVQCCNHSIVGKVKSLLDNITVLWRLWNGKVSDWLLGHLHLVVQHPLGHLLLRTGQPPFSTISSYYLPLNRSRATCLTDDQRQTIEVSHHIPSLTASSFEEVVGETKDPHTQPDIGMIALEWIWHWFL